MVERTAVNRDVVGSSPTGGANSMKVSSLIFWGWFRVPKNIRGTCFVFFKNKPSDRYKVVKEGAILHAATTAMWLDRKPVRSIPNLKPEGDC